MERLTPFGKYLLLDRINVGGMAEVFRAKTVGVEGFEKIVAIKRILPAVAEDEEFIKMFVDEAKITGQLSHANLAQTFDLGKIDDAYYIAMEYVPGKDLRAVQERMRRRGERVPLAVAAYIISRVCEGLDYAHRKRDALGRDLNIVHRDVSPQNVIVSYEGEVKLIDFGIAKAANKITRTQAGILKGKFGYMSPEQVRGLPLDRRSDIFAAGVVLYELCTGERLFTGSSDFSILEKVQQAKITAPSIVLPDMPLRLERVIMKALAREVDDRYQHAAELAQDLTRFLLESNTRAVSRDDVAHFMKETFPDETRQEHETLVEATRTRAPRPNLPPLEPLAEPAQAKSAAKTAPEPERPSKAQRKDNKGARASKPPPPSTIDKKPAKGSLYEGDEPSSTAPGRRSKPPPPLPKSLLDLGEVPPEPEPTGKAPPPAMDEAPKSPALPPMPKLPPITFGEPYSKGASPTVQVQAERPGDAPTRPMSMDELLAAERAMLAQQQRPPPSLAVPDREPHASSDDPTLPGVFVDPATGAPSPLIGQRGVIRDEPEVTDPGAPPVLPKPAPRPPVKAEPREQRPRAEPPPIPKSTESQPVAKIATPAKAAAEPPPEKEKVAHPWVEKSEKPPERRPREGPPKLAGVHRKPEAAPPAPPRPRSEDRLPAYRGRMHVSKPTLVGDDPLPAEEITSSTLTVRQRWIRRGQILLLAVGLAIAGWAWLSVPHRKEETQGPPAGSLTVTTEPDDALVLLDGALVKEALDKDYTEPKLSAGTEHVLTVRRDGFTEKQVPITLQLAEKKILKVALEPLPNQLTVRSSPSAAQVFIDGQKAGVTPAYVPSVDPDKPHAIVLEKKCFKPWQQGLPPNAGRREVMATLEPIPGACPGQRLEREEKPMPELPTDPAQMASIGFLSLGSRPSAQIYIDGVDIGRTTPIVQWPLKVGAHKVKLAVAGKKKELKLEILSGQTVSEIVDLRRK